MKRLFWALVFSLALVGCQGGAYQVPKEEFKQRVQTLAVLPILVDDGSRIEHPQREQIVSLLRRHSDEREDRLVKMLRESGAFFDVREVDRDPAQLLRNLVRDATADQRAAFPYRFSGSAAQSLAEDYVVDGLLVIILHGREVVEKRWDRTRLSFLQAPYNNIMAAVAVIDRSGNILWRLGDGAGQTFFSLQYPDFDEAYYNKSDAVRLKFLSPEGVERTLAEPKGGVISKEAYPAVYWDLFDQIRNALKPGLINPFSGEKNEKNR